MASANSSGASVPESWELAVRNHVASLTPSQREAFVAPASAADCMNIIAKSQRRRHFTRVLEMMKPLLEPLRRFESVIDVVIQTNGGIGSPIWGPLRLAVMTASDHLETIEKLTVILQRIVASLERYSNYEILFKNNLNTQRAIGALYCDLIDLCARVVKFHSRHSISAVFVTFDKEFQQVADNIAHHSTEIDWAANAANIEEAKKARGFEDMVRQGQIRADIQRWLSPSNVQDDLFRHEAECMTGSCDWALRMPELQNFLASEKAQILRIGGAPGIGKSTMAAFIIGHLTQAVRGDVLYFFCKGTDEKKQQPFQVLRTLVSQLLAQDESLYPWFETLYQQSGQKIVESFATLHHSFLMALRNTSRPMIWIVVDALDECHEAQELASSLIAASKASNQLIKLIITSREEPELLDSLYHQSTEFIISPGRVHDFVSDYVKERVFRCRQIRGTEIGFRVHKRVSSGAGGLWLYARLMMDEIQRLPSVAAIERQLENIPNGLVHLYQQIFATMEKSLSPLELRLAQQVFLWVDLSTFVHVGRQSLDHDILDLVFQAENSGEEVFNSLELARQLCAPLVVLYEVSDGRFEVDFVHHTAAQFVRQCSQESVLDVPRILKPQRMKELYRGKTSVWYFEQCPRAAGLLKELRDRPDQPRFGNDLGEYFEMAYGLWDAFFLDTLPEPPDNYEINEVSQLCETMARFLETEACLKWVEMAIIINYAGGYSKLIINAVQALEAANRPLSSQIFAFNKFSMSRRQFFLDYVYVLSMTGPEQLEGTFLDKPDGFDTRPMARKLLSLGQQWAPLCNAGFSLVHRFRDVFDLR